MPVETGLLITGQGRDYVSSAPGVASIAQNTKPSASVAAVGVSASTVSISSAASQDKVLRAQQGLNALSQANQNWAGLRKSMAAMRLQRLVGIIKVLALYGGDPKMVAQRAAELARELKGAIKEFTDSGGDPSTVPGANATIPGANATVPGANATIPGANIDPTAVTASTATGQGNTSTPTPVPSGPASSGFVFQASSVLAQLRTVVALNHSAKTSAAKDRAQQQFDTAAENAAAALDQAKNSVNLLT